MTDVSTFLASLFNQWLLFFPWLMYYISNPFLFHTGSAVICMVA